MRRFYLAEIPTTDLFDLPEEESKHIVRVLRMIEGEEFILQNGIDRLLKVSITLAHPKRCKVKLMEEMIIQQPKPFHLAIAPTKNTDRMEWMVEKIVEIGATELSFLQCDHSERVNLKLDRLERVAISAMKQAQHDTLLKINGMTSFDDFITKHPNGAIAHCVEGDKYTLGTFQLDGPVLIGPEGDFSLKEIQNATENGYKAVHLGQSRLRTETAGMVATVLQIHSTYA